MLIFARVRSLRIRQAVLLLSSYALYITWGAWFAVVLLTSTVLNFLLGEWLRRRPSWSVLLIGILFNLALLSSFKYLPEVAVNIPLSSLQRLSHLSLPLGISFWTFQAMSYLFDLYRGDEIDPSFFEFALYMAFFPIVISGPICRMPEMLPQFRSEKAIAWSDMGRGLCRIATGVLMMQVAKLLGQGILAGDGINSGFDHVARWSGADVWCLAFGYGLQLFFDFSGYSHIAIGSAKVLGFNLPENFARPFQSTNPSIFWTRWHMSLSFWIRDYVFLPLAVLRRELWWRNLALVASMVLFGLWHKASILFVLWGSYNGILLVLHRQVQQLQRKLDWTPTEVLWTPISWFATTAFVSLGWILFRVNSLSGASRMLSAVLSPASYSAHFLSGSLYLLVVAVAVAYVIVLLVIEVLDRYSNEPETSNSDSRQQIIYFIAHNRWFWIPPLYVLALLFVSVVALTHGADAAQFMYQRF
ncbi:MAG: MBOAT family O-acyltransferase [Candidatus Korobacteraceae bacterium]